MEKVHSIKTGGHVHDQNPSHTYPSTLHLCYSVVVEKKVSKKSVPSPPKKIKLSPPPKTKATKGRSLLEDEVVEER